MKNVGISASRSVYPFGIFVLTAIVLSCLSAMSIELLVAAGVLGIIVGHVLADDSEAYWKTIFESMGSRTAMTAILLWLLVSVYGHVLQSGHIVEGLVWAADALSMGPSHFTMVVFLFSALFAVSTGSGFGTISSMSITLFPAGVAIGAHPALIGGAILSGAALGDSIAPVSDTAIIAASTQSYGNDNSRVANLAESVRQRLPIVLIALLLTLVAYWLFGQGTTSGRRGLLHTQAGDYKGLFLLLPTFVVMFLAFRRVNIFVSLSIGILLSVIIGLVFSLFRPSDIICVSSEGGVGGAVVAGISSMSSICILLIVVVALSGLVIRSGFIESVIHPLQETMTTKPHASELFIFFLSSLAGILIAAVNTIANISIAPIINYIGNEHQIHPYRRVTILALSICTFPFILPYGGCVLLLLNGVNSTACGTSLQPYQLLYTTFYPLILLPCILWYCLFSSKNK